MCPALILAVNRTESVIGRTRILTVSIITKKGFKGAGAPIGSKLAITEVGLKKIPETIKESHKGNPNDKEIAKCLVGLKTYGTRPLKFIKIKNKNKAVIKFIKPPKFKPKERKIWALAVTLKMLIKPIHRG